MGYNWARYRYEVKQVCRRRWPCPKLPPSKELLAPVFSHVLNFSIKHKWEWPLALSDIVNVPPGLEEFFQDYKITVTNVAWLTPEERSKLTGDFRILANALCELRETGKLTGSPQKIRHLEELLSALGAVTGRKMFVKKLRQHNEQKEIKTMDDVLEIWEQKIFANGKKEGYENGKKQGFANGKKEGYENGKKQGEKEGFANGESTTQRLVAKNLLSLSALSVEEIARVTGLSIKEIQELR